MPCNAKVDRGAPRGVHVALASLTLAGCGPSTPVGGGTTSGSPSAESTSNIAGNTSGGEVSSTAAEVGSEDAADTGGTTTSTTTSADSTTAECIEFPSGIPTVARPSSTVAGTTPLGEVDFDYAVFSAFGWCDLCIVGVHDVYFTAEPPGTEAWDPQENGMVLHLSSGGRFIGDLGETYDAEVSVRRDGESTNTYEATFVLDAVAPVDDLGEPYDPLAAPTLSGVVDVETTDWSVHGEFIAFYAPDYDTFPVCE